MNVKKIENALTALRNECMIERCDKCPIKAACDEMNLYDLSSWSEKFLVRIDNHGCRSR